jgi:hypothetical protein
MTKGVLMDRVLKLIIEDVSVTRPEQICSQLHLDRNVVLSLLEEMERSQHIKMIKAGSGNVDVIILKQPGRQFYKSSSYATLNNDTVVDEKPASTLEKSNKRTLMWIIIVILVVLFAVIGFNLGWFS